MQSQTFWNKCLSPGLRTENIAEVPKIAVSPVATKQLIGLNHIKDLKGRIISVGLL